MPRLSRQELSCSPAPSSGTAARTEFAARGVGSASMDRISEAAGFSRGAFYQLRRQARIVA